MNTATVKSAVSQLIAGKTTVAGFIQVASKEGVADALQSAIIAAHFADRSKSAENICAELGIETPAKQPAKRTRKQKPTTRKQSDNPKGCDSGKLWRELDGDNCADMVSDRLALVELDDDSPIKLAFSPHKQSNQWNCWGIKVGRSRDIVRIAAVRAIIASAEDLGAILE
ncbi:MAG: hypothetical protein CMK32_08290 [Porticoccaceae bacterium]|nr:hypothetical protein [Porticoccaceae bacterium]